jgi:hypothetical protein
MEIKAKTVGKVIAFTMIWAGWIYAFLSWKDTVLWTVGGIGEIFVLVVLFLTFIVLSILMVMEGD